MRLRCIAPLLALSLLASPAVAGTIQVPGDHPTIQQALDAAVDGDEIVVAPGTYVEWLDTLGKKVTLRSTDPTDPAVVAATVVDAGGAHRALLCDSGEGPDTVIDGLTLTHGRAHAPNGYYGGAVKVIGGDPTLVRCRFVDNFARDSFGGALYLEQSASLIFDCEFVDNESESAGGGAIGLESSSARIERCRFFANTSPGGDGGAIQEAHGASLVLDCLFEDNVASGGAGGAAAGMEGGLTWYVNCRFADNAAGIGAGIGVRETAALGAVGCELVGGTVIGSLGGSALGVMENAQLDVFGCTLVANGGHGTARVQDNGVLSLSNSIVWGNVGKEIVSLGAGSASVQYCDVEGGYAGTGNFDQDPLFVDLPSRDLRLTAPSPCVDAGLAALLPDDDFDLDGDLDTGEDIPFDLRGGERVSGVEVDLGADELGGDDIGGAYCTPATLNSSGQSAQIAVTGSDEAWRNDVTLTATRLPQNQFGYFLASQTQGFVPFAGGSQGHLCLGGTIGRFRSQIQNSGAAGEFAIAPDLTAFPPPLPPAVQAGETWNFQAWFRDVNPTPTSNFTDGSSVLFR